MKKENNIPVVERTEKIYHVMAFIIVILFIIGMSLLIYSII